MLCSKFIPEDSYRVGLTAEGYDADRVQVPFHLQDLQVLQDLQDLQVLQVLQDLQDDNDGETDLVILRLQPMGSCIRYL